MPSISITNESTAAAGQMNGADGEPEAMRRAGQGWAWGLAAAAVGSLLGAALQLQQPVLWPAAGYRAVLFLGGAGALALVVGLRRSALRGAVPWLVVAVLSGAMAWSLGGWRAAVYAGTALSPALQGQDLRIQALVAAMPQVTDAGLRLRLQVESAQGPDGPVRLPPRIDVAWYGGVFATGAGGLDLQQRPVEVHAGDRWALTVRLKAPHGLSNPHGFDHELWLWEQGVQATGYVRAGPRDIPPQRLERTWRFPLEQWRQRVRDAIVRQLHQGEGTSQDRAAGVVAALVTGDQRAIERADWDVFRATGVAHLMSISGLHITMFAVLMAWAVRWLWRRSAWLCHRVAAPTAALLAGVLLAATYAMFSGWGVPAQRTVAMLAALALLKCLGRRWPWPQVWLITLGGVALADPWALLQSGFWLSFIAVAVLFATNLIAVGAYGEGAGGAQDAEFDAAEKSRTMALGRRAVAAAGALLREQWTLLLALGPLTLLLFGQVSVVGLVANLVAIPWVTLVVTPLALAGALWPPLWTLAALALQPMMAVLQHLAQWPWAVAFVPAAPWWAGAAGVCGGALLAMRLPWSVRALALPLLLPVLAWQPARPPQGHFELLAADIGQGNAVLVRTARHALLYDAGPRYSLESDAGHRVIVPLLRALGVRLDVLMLSHRDADHTGGATAVLAQQPQARVTGSIEAGHGLQAQHPVEPCLAGQRWVWDGVTFEVLHPTPSDLTSATRSNAASCVLRIEAGAGGTAVLLAGDIEQPQEHALLARGASVQADMLLVPHHGSKTSSSEAFLQAVAPRTALVQAGYRNRYGHPAPQVLARYEQRGIRVVTSAQCGAASWHSQRPDALDCHRVSSARYWQHRPAP